ncbi:hypothetical protein MATL_G00090560 [Megalops atlanticus]|uniref:Gastrin-releasing peptide n=1 Tax=Megalops atlanticus TaxID=7932 RepID=A0A9D3T7P5_MEGAT|nr:hypothetical protein MATL_G00090560 [Megalops atlanticus]
MGAEFLAWRYRPTLLVLTVLFFVVCKVQLATSDNAAPPGKIYPRGNHWAVGHLMGKKSTDSLFGSGESDRTSHPFLPAPEGGNHLDRHLQPSKLVRNLIRVLVGLESQNQATAGRAAVLNSKKELEEHQTDRSLREVTGFLAEALGMKDSNSS